jgi:hypothetical protein
VTIGSYWFLCLFRLQNACPTVISEAHAAPRERGERVKESRQEVVSPHTRVWVLVCDLACQDSLTAIQYLYCIRSQSRVPACPACRTAALRPLFDDRDGRIATKGRDLWAQTPSLSYCIVPIIAPCCVQYNVCAGRARSAGAVVRVVLYE